MTPSRFARRSVISFLIGVAVTFLTTFDVSPEWRVRVLAYGGLSGFSINASCHLLARVLSGWLARHRGGRFLLAVVYFVGGLLGIAVATGFAAVPLTSAPGRGPRSAPRLLPARRTSARGRP